MSFAPGENVGPYQIVEQLGSGGMATVFKAYHANLDRYVAMKVLHPAFKQDPNFLARFQREARIVANLQHPAIVPVYDFNEHQGQPYLVMRFIDGETLKARLGRGELLLPEVIRVLRPVGEALQYAHGQGVLHRDVKPSNILLTADGGVFLADFGLARIAQAGESTLSQDALVGTPQYISPEQARGEPQLDVRTDVYSLGVVMYELLIGRVPYQADTPYAVIHDHIYAPLPLPRSIKPTFPETLERILLKALAKERDDRYASVAALMSALEAAAGQVISEAPTQVAAPRAAPEAPIAPAATRQAPSASISTTPASAATATSSRRWRWAALGIIAILAVVIVALLVVRGNQLPRDNPASGSNQEAGSGVHPGQPEPADIGPLEQQFTQANELLNQNRLAEARTEFRQVAEKSEARLQQMPNLPPEPRARLTSLAGQSWLAANEPARAHPHWAELARSQSGNPEPLTGLAMTSLLRNDLRAAGVALEQALRLDPNLRVAHMLKACLLLKQNDRLPAGREWRQAGGLEALDKAQPWLRDVLRRLDCVPERFE
jgi:tetratricopeptide (TPR) repeat protein